MLRWVLIVIALGFTSVVQGQCPTGGNLFQRGDVNADSSIDISDPVRVLLYLFASATQYPLDCLDAADANDDDTVTIADPVMLLDFLFSATGPLPAPFRVCGDDLGSPLGCDAYLPCSGLATGPVPEGWIHGSANCATNPDPPFQVQAYDENTFILRQNMCVHFEGPFQYLLFGDDKVLLQDTGATASAAASPIRATVGGIIDQWLIDHGQASIELVVTHSHSHGDHVAGDGQFIGQPNTTVVGTSLAAVTSFFGITNWPEQIVCYDLGGRILDIVPIPGHESRHIAVYDRNTGILLTGDSLYPGFLFVFGQNNWNSYKASIARLVDFTLTRPISHVLGTHIEMSNQPGIAYPYGSNYQPAEHTLALDFSHLLELDSALQSLPSPILQIHDDFIISGQ